MAKEKISFLCTHCDYRPPKWVGCCPECNEWNTITERQQSVTAHKTAGSGALFLKRLEDIPSVETSRMLSGIAEWDRVVGGGLVPGSFLILTGDPGIGKSTLLLQIAHNLAKNFSVLYCSSEESLAQVKQRATRLQCSGNNLLFSDQAQLEAIINTCEQKKPHIVIIDSIQNCYSQGAHMIPGSVGQLRESAFLLMRLAKEHGITIILTGHITKEGTIAGPKMLEHMVDGVFYLQGEERWHTRVLRSVKNRFGGINELGFFEMHENGLEEVPNINEQLINEASYSPGSCLISYIEGTRPLLIELQALVIPTKFGMPQRVVSGVDQKQVVIIAAILEKYLKIKFSSYDIFFKVSGGFKIKESSADLGIALALLSSYFQQPLPQKSLALGEVSLTGQIKPINQISIHTKEAQKFGLKTLIVSHKQSLEGISCPTKSLHNAYELLSFFNED